MSKHIRFNQQIERSIALPYPGEVFVSVGQKVEPDTILARTELLAALPGYFNIARELGFENDQDRFKTALRVSVGDDVKSGDILAEANEESIRAPFNGRIEHISFSNGYLLLRQHVERDDKPLVIKAAKALEISNRRLPSVVHVKVGDEVVRGQLIAGQSQIFQLLAPMSGIISEISTDDGTISIKPFYQPTEIFAGAYGEVIKIIADYGVIIQMTADVIDGIYGAGEEVTGRLVFSDDRTDEPVIRVFPGKIELDTLKACAANNTVGIIAAGIDAKAFMDFYGYMVSEGVTGEEKADCSLILTSGFGDAVMDGEVMTVLEKYRDQPVSMYPQTNIQAPVIKPRIFLYVD